MIMQPSVTAAHLGQVEFSRPRLSEYEQRLRVLDLTVELLIARTGLDDCWSEGFLDAGRMLATVLFPANDFASAHRHLQNAIDYSQQREFGAAEFELRALRGHLHRL
jgi:hypothetical protein